MSTTLAEAAARIGDKVVYRAPGWIGMAPAEVGVITSVNNYFVFVRYDGDNASKAVRPADLEFLGQPGRWLQP